MKLVLDTNILLSALMKDSLTRRIIVESDWKYYYPEMSFHEIRKYKDLVLEKSGLKEADYDNLLQHLQRNISLVPDELIIPYLDKAKKIMAAIDPDDVVFVATALSIPGVLLWSDDTDFDKQKKIKVVKSEKISKLFLSRVR